MQCGYQCLITIFVPQWYSLTNGCWSFKWLCFSKASLRRRHYQFHVLTTASSVSLTDQSSRARSGLTYRCVYVLSHGGTDVRRIDQRAPDVRPQHIMPQHHTPLLTQPTDVMFKDTPPSITSETSTGPECCRVQRDHIRQILAGCNNAVMYAAHRFNGGKESQKTQLGSKAGWDLAKC